MPNEHPTGTPRDTPSLSNSDASQTQPKHSKAESSSTPKTLEEFRNANTALKITVDELAKRNDEHKKEAQKMRDENRILLQRYMYTIFFPNFSVYLKCLDKRVK